MRKKKERKSEGRIKAREYLLRTMVFRRRRVFFLIVLHLRIRKRGRWAIIMAERTSFTETNNAVYLTSFKSTKPVN